MTIKIIDNDIFTIGAKYIAHQCNSITNDAAGIALEIFTRYPYADCYKDRIKSSIPGTIQVCGDGLEQRGIINIFAQYFPGKPSINDTEKSRQKWFHECLMEIAKIPNLHSIAFPYGIGCNLGGGNWNWYYKQLNKFAIYVQQIVLPENNNVTVLLYRLNNSQPTY